MVRIKPNYDPAEHLRDDAEAARRLPGPDYYEVLALLHEQLRPAVYLEIGVLHGGSLRLAQPPTIAIGIDPIPVPKQAWATETRIAEMTSEEFFTSRAVDLFLGQRAIDLAFLDGRHLFEHVVRDFMHVEARMAPEGIIAIHDTIPLDARTSSRERTTGFYTGDVYRILEWLKTERPDHEMVTVPCAPSGLTLVRYGAIMPRSMGGGL